MAEGLLGNYLDGLDEQQQRMAISQGLLGLGSSLLANQYVDPRNPGSGGIAKGLAEGGQAMMAAPQQMRQQAYQDAVMKQKLQEFQNKQKQQEAMQAFAASLPAGDPRREMLTLFPEKAGDLMLKQADRRDEASVNLETLPKLEAAKYGAVTPLVLQRKAGESDIDFQNRIRTESALNPILAGRAGAETAARESASMPYIGQKAMLQSQGSALGGYAADLSPSGIAAPDGRVLTNAEAKASTGNKFTTEQSRAANFANRMATAEPILQQFAPAQSPTGKEVMFRAAGLDTAANATMTKERQQYRNAQEDWVRAKLRLESGAAIGAKEMDDEIKTYFPQYGDKNEVIAQKAQRRAVATNGLISESNGAFEKMFGRQPQQGRKPAEIPALPDGFVIPGGR
jgi:hypothetical protein